MPESAAWSVPWSSIVTGARCHVPGSGAPDASALGGVRSTRSVAVAMSVAGTPAPEIARALSVTVPSGRSVSVQVAPVSIVASGSLPSVVTE